MGSVHSEAISSFLTMAPKTLRSESRRSVERKSKVCAASGSEPESAKSVEPRSLETMCEASRKTINSSQERR